MPRAFHDLTGQQFGSYKAVSYAGKNEFGNSVWNCECVVCGKMLVIGVGALKARKPCTDKGACRCWKDDDKESPEYMAWKSMKDRCFDKNNGAYANYGGRGITVYEPWINSFSTFFEYVGKRPSNEHSLDRYPNNNGNYEPGNVRWATRQEQCRNRRDNRILEHDGKSMTLIEWSEKTGIRRDTIMRRINAGWSVADALTIPVEKFG